MNCKNTLLEYNKKTECWLPRDPDSCFEFCKRCSFYKAGTILQEIAKGTEDFSILDEPKFLQICLDTNLQEHVLNALAKLSPKKQHFQKFYSFLQSNEAYSSKILGNHAIRHKPSARCAIYRQWFKDRKLKREPIATDLPLHCWDCISWILRQKTMLDLYQAFIRCITSSQSISASLKSLAASEKTSLVDSMVSLELKGKPHAARVLFRAFHTYQKNDSLSESILVSFFSHPAMIQRFFLEPTLLTDYLPFSMRSNNSESTYQKKVLQAVRKRNWVFKEDLMIKTWAPHRLFAWCFDLEDLKDF